MQIISFSKDECTGKFSPKKGESSEDREAAVVHNTSSEALDQDGTVASWLACQLQ